MRFSGAGRAPKIGTPDADAQMDALCGVIVTITMLSSFTGRFRTLFGEVGFLPGFDLSFLSLQMFLAMFAWCLMQETAGRVTPGGYCGARVLRYLPIVAPAVLVSAVAASFGGFDAAAGLRSALSNATMVAPFVGDPGFYGAFWRLKIELMFAVGFGVVWYGARPRVGCGILALCLGLCLLRPAGDAGREAGLSALGLLTVDGRLPALAVGIAAFGLAQRRRGRAAGYLWAATLLASAVLVLRGNAGWHGAAVLAGDTLVWLAGCGKLLALGRVAALRWLGSRFFSIFLVHLLPGFAVIRVMESAGAPAPLAVAAAMTVSVVMGAVLQDQVATRLRRGMRVAGAMARDAKKEALVLS